MEYFPLGEELTFQDALIQASQALDLTVMIALEQKDSGRMLDAATTWVKMADFMINLGESQGKRKDFPTGFQPSAQEDIEEEDEDARDESD